MKIGIVILNYNTIEDTIKCVSSIEKYETRDVKIYIVDNDSNQLEQIKLMEVYNCKENIKVIINDINKGFSGGNNQGIIAAMHDKCKVIYLLNSDIILQNNAIELMTEFLIENKIAVVGPSIYNGKGEYVQYARKPLTLKSYIINTRLFEKLFRIYANKLRHYNYDEKNNYIFYGMVSGCCFGFLSEFIEKYGLLDDNIFLYYEEDIIANKMFYRNERVGICCTARVTHNEGESTKKKGNAFQRYYRWTSSLYVLKNYVHVNKALCFSVSLVHIIAWIALSIKKKDYRMMLDGFIKENKKILKIDLI